MPMFASRLTRRFLVIVPVVAVIAIVAVFSLYRQTGGCEGIGGNYAEIKQSWGKGDLFVLIRHSEKCEAVENGCPPGDTGLTAEGIRQARLIGDGLRRLGEGDADIFYSPAVRTEMTAKAALTGTMQPLPWLSEGCKVGLLDKIKAQKRPGANLVLVTHSSCLNDLEDESREHVLDFNAGKDRYFGVSVILRLTGNGQIEELGCALPSQWKELEVEEENA